MPQQNQSATHYTQPKELHSEVAILAPPTPGYDDILSAEALEFLVGLERRFGATREALLQRRVERQRRLDGGAMLGFLDETREIRESDWRIGSIPDDLLDRRVEITGPVDRKMVINALNSGAKVFMADFEDSATPTWDNLLQGQTNVRDAAHGRIAMTTEEGKEYRLGEQVATLIVRPRGWHLPEKHLQIDGKAASGALFDFALFFYHNARALLARGSGPYFYLPKIESHLEARLWNDVFVFAEEALGLPVGTIKATVLIETLPAAFEMDEILYELRDHVTGLNCGRWDYIFSFIKSFSARPDFVLPDRSEVTMTAPFLRAYSQLLIKTCHRRGAFAMGGMAAQIPIKADAAANEIAMEKVRADKEREARDGHDGTWVAHPGLVPIAAQVFDSHMPGANQLNKLRQEVAVTAADLQAVPSGTITETGLRTNVSVAVQYLEAWLGGLGCVPLYNLMEDAATAEISRAQIWQWIKHPKGILEDDRDIDADMFNRVLEEELANIRNEVGEDRYERGEFKRAGELIADICTAAEFHSFLTLSAYEHI
jgi:malate synthase